MSIVITIVILLVFLILISFFSNLLQDKKELEAKPLRERFSHLIDEIGVKLIGSDFKVHIFKDDPRMLNIYSDTYKNKLISLYYSTGHLTITFKYKYFNKELVFEKKIYNVRTYSPAQQLNMSGLFIAEAQERRRLHDDSVLKSDTSYSTCGEMSNPNNPMGVLNMAHTEMTREQKISIINLAVLIGMATGNSYEKIFSTEIIYALSSSFGLSLRECKNYYNKYGEDKIYEDLMILQDKTMLIADVLPSLVDTSETLCQMRQEKMIECFQKIGIPPSKLNDEVEKMMLLSTLFK